MQLCALCAQVCVGTIGQFHRVHALGEHPGAGRTAGVECAELDSCYTESCCLAGLGGMPY
jgi:hypothetical protein